MPEREKSTRSPGRRGHSLTERVIELCQGLLGGSVDDRASAERYCVLRCTTRGVGLRKDSVARSGL